MVYALYYIAGLAGYKRRPLPLHEQSRVYFEVYGRCGNFSSHGEQGYGLLLHRIEWNLRSKDERDGAKAAF